MIISPTSKPASLAGESSKILLILFPSINSTPIPWYLPASFSVKLEVSGQNVVPKWFSSFFKFLIPFSRVMP